MPRGRPRKDAAEGSEVNEKTKPRSISIDAELYDIIESQTDAFEELFGFRPTMAQTLAYILKKADLVPAKPKAEEDRPETEKAVPEAQGSLLEKHAA